MKPIPTHRLPAVLQGKLKFGDKSQINAMRELDRQFETQKKFYDFQRSGQLSYFEVNLRIIGSYKTEVWGMNEDHAYQIAIDMFSGELDDWDDIDGDADEIPPQTECYCNNAIKLDNGKPYNWDQCPKHGNQIWEKRTKQLKIWQDMS